MGNAPRCAAHTAQCEEKKKALACWPAPTLARESMMASESGRRLCTRSGPLS